MVTDLFRLGPSEEKAFEAQNKNTKEMEQLLYNSTTRRFMNGIFMVLNSAS